jgi:hypothetical protein
MKRAVTIVLPLLLLLAFQAQAQPFGAVIYSGDDSADILMFDLTNTNFSKVEFYRGARLLGTTNINANDGGLITDYGLNKGTQYQYQFRAYRTAGGFLDGNLISGTFLGGDMRGILTRPDTIKITTDLVDSIFIYPGGHMHFAPGANISWILGVAGTLSGIVIYGSADPSQAPHGQFSASGGVLNDINIFCWGKFGPIRNMTFYGSDVNIYGNEESIFDNVKFDWVTAQGRNDYAYFRHHGNNIIGTRLLLVHEAQVWGVKQADDCRIEGDATIVASNISNSTVDEGQITIRPAGIPTSARHNNIIKGSVSLSNKTVVEFNTFGHNSTVNISPSAGGFPPGDVADVRVNYNHFTRNASNQVGNIANFQADSIDGTRNYWGNCEGPSPGERGTMGKVKLDPFLRAEYPDASYWMNLEASKTKIIADGEDEITIDGHFFNVLTGKDTAGVELNYYIIVAGDTLYQGTLISDANGKVLFSFKMPVKYGNTTGFAVFFESPLQCIKKSWFMTIEKQTGPDLQVHSVEVFQSLGPTSTLVPNKGFAVEAVILASEAINTPFKVEVEVNGNKYDRFYLKNRDFIDVDFKYEQQLQEMTMPRTQPAILVFLVNELGLNSGDVEISVTVDPAEPGLPRGRIIESNEFNNTSSAWVTMKPTSLGNEGNAELKVFVQPFDGYPTTMMNRLQSWADSASTFMLKTWPVKAGQVSFDVNRNVADYSFIHADTLLEDTYQFYLMKSYKEMRRSNPAADRYVLAVQPDWFTYRLHRQLFNHRASQTLSWSGTWDLMVSSTDHYKHVVHTLGHSFGLRRGDIAPDDETQKEQYIENFIGADVYFGIDIYEGRVLHANIENKVSRRMRAKCFMGSSQLPSSAFDYHIWISGLEFEKLNTAMESFRSDKAGLRKGMTPKALFIEGNIDDATRSINFGPWMRLENATISAMVDEQYATHTFKVLDNSDQEIARYLYRPTFRALGLDELDALSSPDPEMDVEHFAFVVPCPDNARKVIVEHQGNIIAERILSANKPVVSIEFPTNGQDVKQERFLARWTATDADGDTQFWYTVWLSTDNGQTWKMLTYESEATQDSIFALKGTSGYRLRVIANDGVNTSDTAEVAFSVLTSTQEIPSPAAFELRQNYPNPFNPSTTLTFTLPVADHAHLMVYDALGRPLTTVVDDYRSAGTYHVSFNAEGLPSGTYLAVLRSGDHTTTIRMTLAR